MIRRFKKRKQNDPPFGRCKVLFHEQCRFTCFAARTGVAALLCTSILFLQCANLNRLPPGECRTKGVSLLQDGKYADAYKYLSSAAQRDAACSECEWLAAQAALHLEKPDAAYVHASHAWQKGMRTLEIMEALIHLSPGDSSAEQLSYALTLYEQLPIDKRDRLQRGDIFYRFGKYQRSLDEWRSQTGRMVSPAVCTRMALAFYNLGLPDSSLLLLEKCRRRSALDVKGYLILTSLYIKKGKMQIGEAALLEAIDRNPDDIRIHLERAYFLLYSGRFSETRAVAAEILMQQGASPGSILKHCRMLLGYLDWEEGRKGRLRALHKTTPRHSVERAFLTALLPENRGSRAFMLLEKLQERSAYPIVTLAAARSLAHSGQHHKALDAYAFLPEAAQHFPLLMVERAHLLAKAGKHGDAMQTIHHLHSSNLFSRSSLELFRKLAIEMNMIEKAQAAQRLLEYRFGIDSRNRAAATLIAVRSGHYAHAEQHLAHLLRDNPRSGALRAARAYMLAAQEKHDSAMHVLNSSFAVFMPPTLHARVYAMLDSSEQAQAWYRVARKNDHSLDLTLEYADFLIQNGALDSAITLVDSLIRNKPDMLRHSAAYAAMVLNNLSWKIVYGDTADDARYAPSLVVAFARHAHMLQPNNRAILDTYAAALLHAGAVQTCIATLEAFSATREEPQLLLRLAAAYESLHDYAGAAALYQSALFTADTSAILETEISTEAMRKRFRRMSNLAEKQ